MLRVTADPLRTTSMQSDRRGTLGQCLIFTWLYGLGSMDDHGSQ